METHYTIIGAGIMGSALAFELSQHTTSPITVIDIDLDGRLSSTERNAGGVRHLWGQKENRLLSALSIRFFESIASEIGFHQEGYLWLYSKEKEELGESVFKKVTQENLPYSKLSPSEIHNRYPFLDKLNDVSFALFGAKDGLLNSNALKLYFREHAQLRGVQFKNKTWIKSFEKSNNQIILNCSSIQDDHDAEKILWAETSARPPTQDHEIKTSHLILAAGAWTPLLTKSFQENPLIRPIRRQISFFDATDLQLKGYGMIVDTSGVYFHAEGGKILAGFVLPEEKPGYRFDYDTHFFEEHIWPKLYERSSKFERLKPIAGWAGLYSYTPDVTGILGNFPEHENIFECHSFTGHGIMQSYGAAKLLTEKILTGSYQTFDASKLSRNRFLQQNTSSWLPEKLHI